jgi:hypothetical protein
MNGNIHGHRLMGKSFFSALLGDVPPFPRKNYLLTSWLPLGYAALMTTGDLVQVKPSGSIGIIEREYEYVYNRFVQIRILIDYDVTGVLSRVINIPRSYAEAYWQVVA